MSVGAIPVPHQSSLARALGLKAWSHDPTLIGAGTAPVAGTRYSTGIALDSGDTVTNLLFNIAVAGAGTAPTGIYVGLHDTATMLAVSANLKDSAQWIGVGYAVAALAAPFTVPSTGLYYAQIIQVGAWGTTQMTLNRTGNFSGLLPGSVYGHAALGTGQTALASVGASPGVFTTTGTFRYWVGAN